MSRSLCIRNCGRRRTKFAWLCEECLRLERRRDKKKLVTDLKPVQN